MKMVKIVVFLGGDRWTWYTEEEVAAMTDKELGRSLRGSVRRAVIERDQRIKDGTR